jgi:hypothetical protein
VAVLGFKFSLPCYKICYLLGECSGNGKKQGVLMYMGSSTHAA